MITPTYNCVDKIDSTIESVLSQRVESWEYLIIDGGSSDGTLEKICSYNRSIRWISEPDHGIYDAMNKGIRLASGKFLYFLGAGDRMREGALEAVAAEISRLSRHERNGNSIMLYGDVSWSRHSKPYDGPFNRFKILSRNICHQAIFYQQSIFREMGFYKIQYPLFADWEFNIRCFNNRSIITCYIPILIADYEGGGLSADAPDLAFFADFDTLKRKEYGLFFTLLMQLRFLLVHPQELIRGPWRQLRRWLSKRSSFRNKIP